MRYRLPLFYAVTVLFWVSLYAYVPYVTPYAELMDADVRLIGLIAGAYGFWQMLVRFPLGIYSDMRQKRKVFVWLGICFACVSGLVVYVFPNPISMLIGRSLSGVAASVWVIFTILATSYYPPEDSIKAVGFMNAANSMGRVSSLLVGGLVAEWLGFSYAFLLAGLAGLVSLILGVGIVEKKPDSVKKEPPKLTDLLAVAKNHQLLCASLLGIFSQYITFATTFGFTPIVAAHLGASNMLLGLLGVVSTLPSLLLSPFVASVAKKAGVKCTLTIGFAVAGIGAALTPLCQNLWQLFASQLFGAVGTAFVFTLLMGLSIRDIQAERRATAMGFYQALYGLGMFMGPFVMGWISYGLSMALAFAFTGGIGLLAVVCTIIFVNRGMLQNS